ncbi:unnamed protein product [Caenorhabditis angaria]|uniref:C-type lectin domain-containing protein n=1 Tax=Caenorhabditis angaria TaxID=860376 RepID=A0A9P1I9W5_9PELO|nr:unnamed protein product [Caenorhabditis angaria]
MNRVILLLFAFCVTVSCLALNNNKKKDHIDIDINIDVEGGKKHQGGHGSHNDEQCKEHTKKPTPKATKKPTTAKPKTTKKLLPVYVCPKGFTKFNRATPWCLRTVTSKTSIASKDAQKLCASVKSSLSNFENQHETDTILAPLYKLKSNFSLTVDGRRVKQCMKIKTNDHKSPCTREKTFSFPNAKKHTNTAFTIKNLNSGQPDSQQRTIKGKFYIEDCLSIYIAKGTSMDKKYNDIFCDFAVSPVSNLPIYQSRGALCGVAATRKR